MPVNLHVGLRYEETDVYSEAVSSEYTGSSWSKAGNELYVTAADGSFAVYGSKGNYDFLLPVIDFDIEGVDDVILRASFSKTVSCAGFFWASVVGATVAHGVVLFCKGRRSCFSTGGYVEL